MQVLCTHILFYIHTQKNAHYIYKIKHPIPLQTWNTSSEVYDIRENPSESWVDPGGKFMMHDQ